MRIVPPEEAAGLLREGKVVLCPTETVVGLFADEAGVARIQQIKGRDPDKPIALLCATQEEAFSLAAHVPPLARKLAERLWPGPLTLVLDAADGGTVGVRVPDHPVVQALLAAYGGPVFATSANLSGEPAPGAPDEVDPRVAEAVDAVVEGVGGGGEASAVVDLSKGRAKLLRPAAGLTEQDLARM